jgi:hypothetical protein
VNSEIPSGWVKPERDRTLPELKLLIAAKRAELQELERQAASLSEHEKLQAIASARNIMRAHQLSVEDVLQK